MRSLVRLAILILFIAAPVGAAAEKIMRIGLVSLPQDLGNPYGSYTIPTVTPGLAVFDSLTVVDIEGTLQPWIAERWESIDPLTWHFTLKPNVTFSNGEPFDAAAAAAALNYFASGDGLIEVVAQSVIDVASARAIDPLVLEVKTKAPNILLPRRLSGIRIPAPGPWAELGRRGFAQAPVGSGPFIATRWGTTQVDLIANTNSWRAPKLDRIEVKAVPEITTRVQGLITGALDIALDIGPDDGPILETAGAQLNIRPSGRVQLLTFMSIGDSPLADVRVRQALNYAVNKQQIIDILLGGATEPSGQAAVKASFGYNPDVPAYPYDPDKARALLAEAGYPDGFDLPADMTPGAMAGDGAWYLQIANNLADVGVRVTYQSYPFTMHIRKIRQGGWKGDAFGMDFNNLPSLDVLWPLRIHSCLWAAPWHCRPEWVPLIEDAEQEFDLEERRRKTQALVQLYHDEPTSLYLWEMPGVDGVSDRVLNYQPRHAFINFHEIDVKD
ncbi:MAG: ABC transporter substrate-binding protein [Rhodospirillaceae bacterium]|jgi:peptide/nickel transport system substrate-binding protein|nr:ABC transporter substrate-binding protein [Rhodospirillaceae bacterium]MBT5566220.1 ABC transporter substrate-binding protein [Rhodospirillaceae bacterium]MBT6088938.1 ABC transporter substrate-binding protein [Rhodospirillaceae bacterium]MBT6961355.1 ABC transporter substrate-binding protein [Rhodospirillaceae bacterium]